MFINCINNPISTVNNETNICSNNLSKDLEEKEFKKLLNNLNQIDSKSSSLNELNMFINSILDLKDLSYLVYNIKYRKNYLLNLNFLILLNQLKSLLFLFALICLII